MNTMGTMCDNIKERQVYLMDLKGEKPDKRNKAWPLFDKDPQEMISFTYGHILTKIEVMSELTNILVSVGNSINRKYKLRFNEVDAIHLGWFIFLTYVDIDIVSLIKKRKKKKNGKLSKHSSYHVRVKDAEALNSIMESIAEDSTEMFPTLTAPADWVVGKFYHESGYPLIKKAPHEDAVAACKQGGTEYLIETLNKLNKTAWSINPFVFNVFKKCTFLTSNKTPFKFRKEVDPTKRASLEIEARAIEKLAERNLDNVFYHLYNVDFRGRIYPNTAFLHEQSSDNAKGLLLLDTPVPLGDEGFYWLSVHTANMWGNDKVSLDDRASWVQDNFDKIVSYVNNPLINDDWMEADKPFCFLACCNELKLLQDWVGKGNSTEDFPSCLPIYIDGSNNGVQHLVAMSKDELVAPLVNLVPQDLPGDVYMFIANKVISQVKVDSERLLEEDGAAETFKELYDGFVELEQAVNKHSVNSRSELFSQAIQRRSAFGNARRDALKKFAPLYWHNIKNPKTWRKTVKRPVMTLGYGAVKYGMVEQVHDDTRDISTYLRDKHKSWSAYLGDMIYETCYRELEGPAKMLRMFESLGEHENNREWHDEQGEVFTGKPITFRQIITGLPFVHAYRKGVTKTVKLSHNGTRMELEFTLWENATLNKDKQTQSAPPNIVHSLDAVHLSMFIHDTDYPVTVVHDSFGCHAGNMGKAFYDVRRHFVELYDMNPLEHIFKQMDATHLIPTKGNLDVSEIINSDFAFA
jgi:DNA-directed RNA polymerase